MKCAFSTDITERISCDPKGDFNDMGFGLNKCEKYPCDKIKKLWAEFDEPMESKKEIL